MHTYKHNIKTTELMVQFGKQLAQAAPAPLIFYLFGELGAGKTTLVRGFLHGLGHQGLVKSPTYTIVEPYQINEQTIYHLDLYRLSSPEELEYIGIRDYFSKDVFCLIEWPERGKELLPEPDLICKIVIAKNDPDSRSIDLTAKSTKGEKLLRNLAKIKNQNY